MKKLLFLVLAVLMTGCVVYPGYDGYYDSGYNGYPYGYVSPRVNLNFNGGYINHYGGHGYYRGGHGGGWRR